jgi:hypothetical protein
MQIEIQKNKLIHVDAQKVYRALSNHTNPLHLHINILITTSLCFEI